MNLRIPTILLILVACFSVATAQEPGIRTSIEENPEIWVGQRFELIVEIRVPGIFAGAANFDLPNPPGMLVMPPVGNPVLATETIDGVEYTVQRHEISVLSRQPGKHTIPAFPVRTEYKKKPSDSESIPASLETQPIDFTAKQAPGTENLGNVISARNLKAVEQWNPEPVSAKAGDAFTRTITFSAPDVPAMAFPVFPTGKLDGIGIYPKPPEVLDSNYRGTLEGERRDVITYLCQRPGEFTIPAVQLTWFDLDSKKPQTIVFPARTIKVAPNPDMPAAESGKTNAGTNAGKTSLWLSGVLLTLIFLILPGVVYRKPLLTFLYRSLAPFRPVRLQALNPPSRKPRIPR